MLRNKISYIHLVTSCHQFVQASYTVTLISFSLKERIYFFILNTYLLLILYNLEVALQRPQLTYILLSLKTENCSTMLPDNATEAADRTCGELHRFIISASAKILNPLLLKDKRYPVLYALFRESVGII